jgi:Domain of unknown function (DUF4037)
MSDVAAIAGGVNDTADPVVTGFYEWGPWVNGGSWLTIGGQRVDFLYKNLDQLERVIRDAYAGRYEHNYSQQPPFGFYSDTYLAELQTCVPLYDPEGLLAQLKASVADYPERLRTRLIQDALGGASFDLYGATKAAEAADPYLTLACCIRAVNGLIHALFAVNRRYRVNDKTALLELGTCPLLPRDLCARVRAIASHVGDRREEQLATVERVRALVDEALVVDESSPAWLRCLKQATGK